MKRRGRPPLKRAVKSISVKFELKDLDVLLAAARADHRSLAAYIRLHALEAARRELSDRKKAGK